MAAEKRTYAPREKKLISQWIKKNYPDKLQWRRVRIGAIPGTESDKFYKGLRRWVDWIIWDGETVILVEAKMRPQPEAIIQLELYRRVFPETPEFTFLKDKPIRLIFLTTKYDQFVDEICKERGVEFVVFAPDWVEEWWREKIEKMSSV